MTVFVQQRLCFAGMWVAGWQVLATKQVRMGHTKEPGGTHKPETQERCWGKQQGIALGVMQVRHSVGGLEWRSHRMETLLRCLFLRMSHCRVKTNSDSKQ